MSAHLLQILEPSKTPVPRREDEAPSIGIDLGTTNSVVAVSTEGNTEVLRDEDGEALLPSVVAYAADGSAIVGGAARMLVLDNPECVIGSIKRLMGRGANEVTPLAGALPSEASDGAGMVRLNVAGHRLTPVQISGDILGALKARAEKNLGHGVERAVITVPAHFDDAARQATKDAARLAGLLVLRLINEPTAAALAYGLDKEVEGLYAVYDFGGGTFDISILRMEKGVFQVLATGGDSGLGGDDFDHEIAQRFLDERSRDQGEAGPSDAKVALLTARQAKEDLSTAENGEWELDINGARSVHRLDRSAFEDLIAPYVERTAVICTDVIADAGVTAEQIEGVVLVGGSTRVPLVRRRVAGIFGRQPLSDIDPDEVVAVGAALQAETLTAGSGTLLLDVTALSLGIETMGGLVEKIISRNTPIPVAKAQEFTTYQDGQTGMSILVVQGEREMADQCRSLARFELAGIPALTAGAARILVTFAVDADGLLTVKATEDTTGIEAHVRVKPSYGLTDDEMTEMLYDSMKHAQEDMTRRLLAEARVEAGRAVKAVDSALAVDRSLLNEAEVAEIEQVKADVEKAIGAEDRDAINAAVENLDRATQSFAERRMDRSIGDALKGVDVDRIEDVAAETFHRR